MTVFILSIVLSILRVVRAGPATEMAAFKGQFCTDPRTMRKHAAYTEWADAYSCTRHRCQPGGRNLAIYTVGCKRVEAPESAIECEEVVEDTNMQFPYCCTRLRCLVVVRGEVWTRVLGQPWETLPAAPWSHMYKMKKPPPTDGTFSKTEEGPVYELQTPDAERDANLGEEQKVLRSNKKAADPECNDVVARASPPAAPDIVIALSTGADKDNAMTYKDNAMTYKDNAMTYKDNTMAYKDTSSARKKEDPPRHKRGRNQNTNNNYFEEPEPVETRLEELEESVTEKEKIPDAVSEERYEGNYPVTQKPFKQAPHHLVSWTEIPQNQWNEHDPSLNNEQNNAPQPRSSWNEQDHPLTEALRLASDFQARSSPTQTWEHQGQQPEFTAPEEKKGGKPGNLQALVDAIGTRMKDIESVVAKMSEKVHQERKQAGTEFGNPHQTQMQFIGADNDKKYHVERKDKEHGKTKKPNPNNEHYKSRGSKYLRAAGDITTEQPLFVEDTNLNGYFSDASNSLINRRSQPKEPAATYMAPVESRRKATHSDSSDENDKKRKKRVHKKKRTKGHHKKHHGKEDKRRKFRLNSVEQDRNAVSLEDSSAVTGNSNANNGTFDNSIE